MFIIEDDRVLGWAGETPDGLDLPAGPRAVGKAAFANLPGLRRVTLSEGLATLGPMAFEGCASLETVRFAPGLRRLGTGCFRGCVSLRAAALPDTVASIQADAFRNCASLEAVDLPAGMQRNVEGGTFAGCAALRRVSVPESVRQIKSGAFEGCAALREVAFRNPEVIIEVGAFAGCGALSPEARAFIDAHRWQNDVVDIRSRAPGPAGRLSNYTARRFLFDGVPCGSIEGVLQSLKCPDPQRQREICLLAGGWATHAGQAYDWKANQTLYWQGRAYARSGEAYRTLIARIYDAAFEQDAAFREDLLAMGNRRVDHRIGRTNPAETVLTRSEFVRQLTRLMDRLRDE